VRKGLLASLAVLVGGAGLVPAQPPPAPAPQMSAPSAGGVSLGQPLPLDSPADPPAPAAGPTMWTAAGGTPVASPSGGDPVSAPPIVRGESEPLPPPPPPPPPPLPPPGPPLLDGLTPGRGAPCFWANTEYLLWWIKSAPVPAPLLTTGSTSGVNPGALNDPTTRVLLGGANENYNPFSGFRGTLGGWLDSCQTWGLEATGFFLAQQSRNATVASGGGVPPLFIPYVNPFLAAPGDAALPITVPGAATAASLASSSSLWGVELRGLYNFYRNDFWHSEALFGFRYLNLGESLDFNAATTFSPGPGGLSGTLSLADSFQTRNQFYGGEIGARGGIRWGRLTVDGFTTVALGDMNEAINVNGFKSATATIPGFGRIGGSLPGGFFAESSNIGHQSKNHFAVVPEVGLQVGYLFTPHFRAFVGYNFLYASNVVRPGNQMDTTVNPTQLFGTPPLFGPARPAPLFHQTDFWAQGVTFGLEFRW
jgi:hypothetical protein